MHRHDRPPSVSPLGGADGAHNRCEASFGRQEGIIQTVDAELTAALQGGPVDEAGLGIDRLRTKSPPYDCGSSPDQTLRTQRLKQLEPQRFRLAKRDEASK